MLILEVFVWLTLRNLISLVNPLLVSCSFLEYSSVAVTFKLSFSGDCLSCAFFPFDVFLLLGSHISPRVTKLWVLVPSRRFSHPQGFHPPNNCWLYFTPVPSMGFFPLGLFSTDRAVCFFKHRFSHVVSLPAASTMKLSQLFS